MNVNETLQQKIQNLVEEYESPSGALGWAKLHADDIDSNYEVEQKLHELADEHGVNYNTVASYYHKQVNKQSSGFLPF